MYEVKMISLITMEVLAEVSMTIADWVGTREELMVSDDLKFESEWYEGSSWVQNYCGKSVDVMLTMTVN